MRTLTLETTQSYLTTERKNTETQNIWQTIRTTTFEKP